MPAVLPTPAAPRGAPSAWQTNHVWPDTAHGGHETSAGGSGWDVSAHRAGHSHWSTDTWGLRCRRRRAVPRASLVD